MCVFGYVYVWVLCYDGVCMCGFCNVRVCVFVDLECVEIYVCVWVCVCVGFVI